MYGMNLMGGIGLFAMRQGGGGSVPEPSIIPPENWRMPATVTTDISGAQSSLAAAQTASASKSRPSVTVPSSSTRYIEWTVAEAGSALVSFIANGGTFAITKNGVDQGFAPTLAPGSAGIQGNSPVAIPGLRQFKLISVAANDVIRLTCAAGGNVTLRPLLHKMPATGPKDTHLLIGASLERELASEPIESAIAAIYPNRDPLVFNWGIGGALSSGIADQTDEAVTAYNGIVSYPYIGTMLGGDVTSGRPYTSGQAASITANLNTVLTKLNAGIFQAIGIESTTYRQYESGLPADQSLGSKPYNDNVLFPWIAANLPDLYDASLQRARLDTYLLTLYYRNNLRDEVHGDATFYTLRAALIADTWMRRIYTGSWFYTSQAEVRVAAVEAAAAGAGTGSAAKVLYDEAILAMAALASTTTAKTALVARLNAVQTQVLYRAADDLVAAAEASKLQADKNAAQTAINAASAVGANVTPLQTRLDAIATATVLQTIYIRHGNGGAIAGWNNANEPIEPSGVAGVVIANLVNNAGANTGFTYEQTEQPASGKQIWTGTSTNTAQTSGVAWVPNAVLTQPLYWNNTNNPLGVTWEFSGLNNSRKYDIAMMGSRTGGTGRNVIITVNGVDLPQMDCGNNTSTVVEAVGVSPVSGKITLAIRVGNPNNAYGYLNATRIIEKG